MTNGDSELAQDQTSVRTPGKSSLGKLAIEWFWRGEKVTETKRAFPGLSARAGVLAARARAAAQLAFATLSPAEPLETLVEGSASELYRQSAYWALCALSKDAAGDTSYSESVWDSLDDTTLARAVPDPTRREALRATLRQGSFVHFAELSAAEQLAVCVDLRALAEALLNQLNERNRVLERVYLQRASHLALVIMLAISAVGVVLWLRSSPDDRNDLLAGKEWRAISKYDGGGCTSPAQKCAESPGFFFHTKEENNPWIEFDLGKSIEFTTVVVDNRPEYTDRAIPLVIEISNNRKKWHQMARRDTDFATWRATFTTSKGRYVRLHVEKRSYLHLQRVRVLP